MLHQIAGGERHADGGLRERLAAGADHLGTGLDAAGGKRDVVGDHHGLRRRPRGNPVVRSVGSGLHQHEFDEGIAR